MDLDGWKSLIATDLIEEIRLLRIGGVFLREKHAQEEN